MMNVVTAENHRRLQVIQETSDTPNIVHVTDSWTADGNAYYITALSTAGSLQHWINRVGGGSEKVVRRWTGQLLNMLQSLHAAGEFHGDLRCDTIFIVGGTGDVRASVFRRLDTGEFVEGETPEESRFCASCIAGGCLASTPGVVV